MQRHHKLSRAKAALLLCLQNSRIFELAKMVVLGALAVKQPHYLEFHVFDLLLLLVKNKNGFLLLSLVSLEFIITRTRTRTNTNPNGTEANAAGRSGNARALRK